jgi:hypothetical protein
MIRKPIVLAALASAAICAAAPAAQAQGILDIGRIILGLPTEEKEPIDYRERAPIVVPPNQQALRPPGDARPADQRRANWPQDPDVAARRQAAAEARRPVSTDSVTSRDDGSGLTRRLSPAEIRAGRVAGGEVPGRPAPSPGTDNERSPGGANINVFGGLAALRELDRRDAAAGRQSGDLAREEPRREFLTDPPSGLRRPSESAPFRATREGKVGAREEPKPYDIYREGPNTR